MNKKTLIQMIVIVIAFGGSGLVLYNGLFKDPAGSGSGSGSSASTTLINVASIFPYGEKLDFTPIYKQHIRYGEYGYPVLSTSTDVGIATEGLLQALDTTVKQ